MSDMTWKDAVVAVLQDHGAAMHYTDIAHEIVARGFRTSVGATPPATVNGTITWSIKHEGAATPFVRAARGEYMLKEHVDENAALSPQVGAEEPDHDDSSDTGIIQAFGMFWERSSVHWSSSCALLGRQQIGADVVDFAGQRGVYLLHDGREVIYVGRSSDRPLGRRLYEHTLDRLRSRWDRFSWFGLRAVGDDAKLGEVAHSVNESTLITTLEAVLIEGLEPRQNRRRGDDFTAAEYLQAEDPAIEKQQLQSLLNEMQNRLATDR